MNHASALMNPRIDTDEKGKFKVISKENAEKRLDNIFKKFARPQKKASTETQQQRKKRIINFLLTKEVTDNEKKQKIKSGEIVGSNDTVFLPTNMAWKDKGYFFNEIVNWNDIFQGSLGDCYFLAALCSTAYINPFLIKNVTGLRYKWSKGIQKETPWHAIDFYVPKGNYESSNAWSNAKGTTQTVVVSEEVLVNETSNRNYGVRGPNEALNGKVSGAKSDLDSCWPAVYEKAYSKFLEKCTTDYPYFSSANNCLINGGYPAGALKEILHTEQVAEADLSGLTEAQIWTLATNARYAPTCAAIYSYYKYENGQDIYYGKAGTQREYLQMGLYIGHAYSILGTITYNNTKYIVIRNPHGTNLQALKNNPRVYHKSWSFNYGANSKDTYRGTQDIFRSISGSDDPAKSYGLFLLELSEFKRVFNAVQYYNGPTLNYGATSLIPDPTPVVPANSIRYFKLTNKGAFVARINVQYTDPSTGTTTTWSNASGNITLGKSATVDLSKKNLKAGTKVKLVAVVVAGKNKTSKEFIYHPQSTKTASFTISGTTLSNTLKEV